MTPALSREERDTMRARAEGGLTLPTDVPALLDALDAAEAEIERVRAVLADMTAAWKVAADSPDRFRDALCECLGHDRENPGDDFLVAEIRACFGYTGPEPIRWRGFLTGALARLDQINAMPDPLRAVLAADDEGGRK